MAITWDIKEIKINDNNGVTYVHYFAWDEEVTGEGLNSRTYHGYYDGFVEYEPDAESDGYTVFNDLTKEQVLGWVNSTIGSEMVTTIENAIAAQITNAKQLEAKVAFPWSESE
jgi:hypothetical protein